MKIRKGPCGSFAVELVQESQIYTYALEIIESATLEGVLPAFDEEKSKGIEISFDHTGMTSIADYQTADIKDAIRKKLREAVRGLFEMIIRAEDMLLVPSNFVLDPRFIFIDQDLKFNLCYIPIMTGDLPEIKCLNEDRIEHLLQSPLFESILTPDEISAIVFAVKNNDEDMLRTIFKEQPNETEKTKQSDLRSALFLAGMALLIVIISTLFLNRFIAFLTAGAVLIILLKTLYDSCKSVPANSDGSDIERTRILFEEEKKDETDDLFSFAELEAVEGTERYGLYANETSIGSDRFLADICMDDDKISPIQAKILRIDNSYYLVDCSVMNNTFIENRKLVPEERYEIKNSQILGFADKEFRFKIGF